MIIRKVKVTEYEYQAPINYVAGATEPDIQFQLTDYEIPSGATGRVYVGRSDGTFEYTVATISGNNVTVAPTSSMFSVKGPGAIQVTLYVGNEVVKNFAIPVYVHADLADDSAEAGSDVTGVFRAAEEEALADFQEQAEEIAEEVKESIPEDYTELTEEVEQLNERLSSLNEFAQPNITVSDWRRGGISNENGTDFSATTLINTTEYIDDDVYTLWCADGYSYRPFLYTADGTYIGFVRGDTHKIAKTGGIPYFTDTFNLYDIKKSFPGVKIKIALLRTDNAVMSVSESVNMFMSYSNDNTNEYISDLFEVGSIDGTNGILNNNVTVRLRSKFFEGNEVITSSFNISFILYAWDKSGSYLGQWNGTGWVKGGSTYYFTTLDLNDFPQNYAYRVVGMYGEQQITTMMLNSILVRKTAEYDYKVIPSDIVVKRGTIDKTNGLTSDFTIRYIITELYGNECVYSNKGGRFFLYAYKYTGEYVGVWTGTTFSAASSASAAEITFLDLGKLDNTYKYMICGYPFSDSNRTLTAEDLVNVIVLRPNEQVKTFTPIKTAIWNIGHFSGGGSPGTTITDANYAEKKAQFRNYIQKLNADILMLPEYSYRFATLTSRNVPAREDLFCDYQYGFVGKQRNYSCNALYSMMPIYGLRDEQYACNQDAEITHSDAILATDYCYSHGVFIIDNEEVHVIGTHCAFDLNNDDVEINQYNELITLCANYKHVILLGDFNAVHDVDEFDLFRNAGYTLANHGYMGDLESYKFDMTNKCLDNIMVKGLGMKNIQMVSDTDNLSDHNAITCELCLAT